LVRALGEIAGRSLPQPNYGDEPRLWLIRAGEEGQGHEQFVSGSVVAIGWNEMGDVVGLSSLDEIREAYRKTYPDASEGNANNCVGGIFGFLSRIRVGDVALYPVKGEDHVYLGVVTGEARFDPEGRYTTVRPVRWLGRVPREDLPDHVKLRMNLPPTCFEISDPGAEFWDMVRHAELYADLAKRFMEIRSADDKDGEEVRRHSKEHQARRERWKAMIAADHVDRGELLKALKDMDWFEGAKKTTAPEYTETDEKAQALLDVMKAIAASPPTDPKGLARAVEKEMPKGFSYGFLTEVLTYIHPESCWELNNPIHEAVDRLGFRGWGALKRGDQNEPGRYFALRPMVDGLRSALELAGLDDPTYLDVDLLLYEIGRKPENFPMLPVRIDEAALSALIEDLRANYPAFEKFDQRDSDWWREERVYKDQLVRLFRNELPDEILKADETESWALKVVDGVKNVLLKPLPSEGKQQNLLSWRHSQHLRPLRDDAKSVSVFARAVRDLLVGVEPADERLQRFTDAVWPLAQGLPKPPGPAFSRGLPTLLLMLGNPLTEIFIRTEEFMAVAKALTGDGIIGDGPLSAEEYRRAREFAKTLFDALATRGFEPQDMIDIQGFIFAVASRNTWVLQANSTHFDLPQMLRDGHREVTWRLPKYVGDVREDDEVYMWVSNPGRGVVAHGRLTSRAVKLSDIDRSEWVGDEKYYPDGSPDPKDDPEHVVFVELDEVFPD
ncbi:MAG: restriction endonuclease, partial [Rhodothermia bacterium]